MVAHPWTNRRAKSSRNHHWALRQRPRQRLRPRRSVNLKWVNGEPVLSQGIVQPAWASSGLSLSSSSKRSFILWDGMLTSPVLVTFLLAFFSFYLPVMVHQWWNHQQVLIDNLEILLKIRWKTLRCVQCWKGSHPWSDAPTC
jgi:hypothetical protein